MPLYEHVFLARQDASSQQVDDLTNQFKAIVEGAGGKVAKTEYWGVKSLSYRMNKNRKAHFTLMNLEAPPAAINEIERQERLSDDILRYLTVKVDELEDGPSVLMHARTSREERTRRHDDGGGRRDRDDRPRDRDDRPRRDETRSAGATPSETAAPAETTAATETAAPAETATPSE
jgi:small subunit ribosomal protein S6